MTTHTRPRKAAVVRTVTVPVMVFALLVSQVTGWSVFATSFADGAVRRSTDAITGATARDELDRLRALQKKGGLQRPVLAIEAEIEAALNTVVRSQGKTVRELTRDCAAPTWAPVTCSAVGKLKAEIATAREAADLPARIEAAAARVKAGPQVADGNPYLAHLSTTFGGASPDDIKFWLVVAIVLGIGAIANLGPGVMVGMGGGGEDRHRAIMHKLAWVAVVSAFLVELVTNALFGYRVVGAPLAAVLVIIACFGAYCSLLFAWTFAPAPLVAEADRFGGLLPPSRSAWQSHEGGTTAGGPSWGPPAGPGPGGSGYAARAPLQGQVIMPPSGAHHMSGAPINITVGTSPAASTAAAATGPAAAVATPAEGRASSPLADAPRRAGPEAPGQPVARGRVQQLIDMVLTFEAACLADDADGVVSADEVYRAFLAWGKGRTLPPHTLIDLLEGYSERARRVEVAGRTHFAGVRLAGEPQRLVAHDTIPQPRRLRAVS